MRFGLIGEKLDYSFSKTFFEKKFQAQNLNHSYLNFELASIEEFPSLLKREKDLVGLNVTIPYKEQIIPYLDELGASAKSIGAVNTILIKDGKLIGYNTDVYGFEKSIQAYLSPDKTKSLILGSGGASKAIAFVLQNLGLSVKLVSRNPEINQLNYKQAGDELDQYQIIINTTPLGTFPEVENQPPLPLERVYLQQFFFDLIYNPLETKFLKEAKSKGAITKNGLEMLELQANKSWDIWNEF